MTICYVSGTQNEVNMCISKVQHMTEQKTNFFQSFDFLTNIATDNWKISEFVQLQLMVQSFAVGFSLASVIFSVQFAGPENTILSRMTLIVAT